MKDQTALEYFRSAPFALRCSRLRRSSQPPSPRRRLPPSSIRRRPRRIGPTSPSFRTGAACGIRKSPIRTPRSKPIRRRGMRRPPGRSNTCSPRRRPAGRRLIFANCLPEAHPSWMLVTHNAMEFLFTPGRVTMLGEFDGNRHTPHLHRRPRPSGDLRSDLPRPFDRPLGRRHACGRHRRTSCRRRRSRSARPRACPTMATCT